MDSHQTADGSQQGPAASQGRCLLPVLEAPLHVHLQDLSSCTKCKHRTLQNQATCWSWQQECQASCLQLRQGECGCIDDEHHLLIAAAAMWDSFRPCTGLLIMVHQLSRTAGCTPSARAPRHSCTPDLAWYCSLGDHLIDSSACSTRVVSKCWQVMSCHKHWIAQSSLEAHFAGGSNCSLVVLASCRLAQRHVHSCMTYP